MALVDLSTGKIFGCKEGNKVWYHEKGHIVFNNSNFGAKINYYGSFFQMLAVFFLSLSIIINNLLLHVFTFCLGLSVVACYLFEETWCWVWGLKEWKKNKKVDI